MKVIELIEKFYNGEIKDLSETLATSHYAPFAKKYALCSSVLDQTNTIDESTGVVTVDNVMTNMVFTISVLSLYTNLEFSSGKDAELTSTDEYDLLCKNELLRPIIDTFAEEYAECYQMLETMQRDVVSNSNDVQHIVAHIGRKLTEMVEPLIDIATMKLESLDLSQDNIDKYMKLIELIGKK